MISAECNIMPFNDAKPWGRAARFHRKLGPVPNTHGVPTRTEIVPFFPTIPHRGPWTSASAAEAKTSVANAIVNPTMVFISFRSTFYLVLNEPTYLGRI
jgi:hypothetical protein